MGACVQPVGMKTPAPSPGAGFATGGEGGRGAYLDTPIGSSLPQVFEGRTVDGEENLRRKNKYKHIVPVAMALIRNGEKDAGKALLSCGRYFKLKDFPCGTVRLVPFPCDSVFCPDCAARRSKPLQDRILKRLDQKKHGYFFLTLTVRSWQELNREAIDRLVDMFRQLRESQEWLHAGISGGVYSIEATYTHAGWHPHLHILIETKRGYFAPVHLEGFKKQWFKITQGSHVIHISRMHGKTAKGGKTRRINRSALRELVKYATKGADFSDRPDRVLEFFHAFKSVRRMQSFGSCLEIAKEAEKELREPGQEEPVGCFCGMCSWADGKFVRIVHISETFLTAEGVRQLRLFDSGSDPPPKAEWIDEKSYQIYAKRAEDERQLGLLAN